MYLSKDGEVVSVSYPLVLPGRRALTCLEHQQLPAGASKWENNSSSTVSSTMAAAVAAHPAEYHGGSSSSRGGVQGHMTDSKTHTKCSR